MLVGRAGLQIALPYRSSSVRSILGVHSRQDRVSTSQCPQSPVDGCVKAMIDCVGDRRAKRNSEGECARNTQHFCLSSDNSIAMVRATHLLNDLDADLALLFFELGINGTACSSHHCKHHSNTHVFNQPPCVNPPSVRVSSLCVRAEEVTEGSIPANILKGD